MSVCGSQPPYYRTRPLGALLLKIPLPAVCQREGGFVHDFDMVIRRPLPYSVKKRCRITETSARVALPCGRIWPALPLM